jgi:hypothetical protein
MMGMHTQEIKSKCGKCTEYHIKKLIPGSDFPADWCKLADMECSMIKSCDKKALAWIKVQK